MKAHVIPEAFFRELREGSQAPLLVSGSPSEYPSNSPIGIYDREILCGECEPKFGILDDYGIQILLRQLDQHFLPLVGRDGPVAFQAEGVNQEKLLKFLVSVLWRASVSRHRFYGRVDLGPYEPHAKQVLLDPHSPVPPQFGAVLSRWTAGDVTLAKGGLMDPFRERWDGINAYRFYFGEVVAYIRVDTQSFRRPLSELALLRQHTTTMIARSFNRSSDFAAMAHTAQKSHLYQQMRFRARAGRNRSRRGSSAT